MQREIDRLEHVVERQRSIGRLDNFYWGLLYAPLLPVGIAFAPAALRDLVGAALRPSPVLRTT